VRIAYVGGSRIQSQYKILVPESDRVPVRVLNLQQGLHRRWETVANQGPHAGYVVKRAKKLCPLRSPSSCCYSDGSRKVSGVEARCWKHNQTDMLESTAAVMQAPFDPAAGPCASPAPS
jgi:predicted SPOUT superfamily RNA methylase MTH1